MVDEDEIKGEKNTGYEDGAQGPFRCDNCEYYRPSESSCGQKIMVKRSKQRLLPSGRRKVSPSGCCEYIDRKGEKKLVNVR